MDLKPLPASTDPAATQAEGESPERQIGVRHLGANALGGVGVLLRVAGEHQDGRAVSSERTRRLLAEAARGAGDHEAASGQVDSVEHVLGG